MKKTQRLAILALFSVCAGLAARPMVSAQPSLVPELTDRAQGPSSWAGDLSPISTDDWSYQRARHLLNRAGFGGTPEEVSKLAAMTPREAVEFLVHYERVPNDGLPEFEPSDIWYRGYPGRESSVVNSIREAYRTGTSMGLKALGPQEPLDMQDIVNESYYVYFADRYETIRLAQWWANRMLLSHRPLEEKLAFFWHGHFATANNKAWRHDLMKQQYETLRDKASGSFRDLLVAVSQDPQMLIWLDNRSNTKEHPNENYAREIMELFCLGVGNYTEDDIRELARAFTGWTLSQEGLVGELEGKTLLEAAQFYDDPSIHDDGVKTILGRRGNFDGYSAIDVILSHPATARFLSAKLYRFFVREELSAELHRELATILAEGGYELKPWLTRLFLSRDFYSSASFATRLKSPVELVVSTYRQLGLGEVPGVPDFRSTTAALGQELFYPPNVAGWNGGRSWINPATLFDRGNFAHDLFFPHAASDPSVVYPYPVLPGAPRRQGKTMEEFHVAMNEFLEGRRQAYLGRRTEAPPAADDGGQEPAGMAGGMAAGGMASGMGDAVSNRQSRYQAARYNLGIGVAAAMTKLDAVVKPIERVAAEVSLVSLVRGAGARDVSDAVDALMVRFLMVPLPAEGRQSLIEWMQEKLGSDRLNFDDQDLETVLRRATHVILSAPEYQLG